MSLCTEFEFLNIVSVSADIQEVKYRLSVKADISDIGATIENGSSINVHIMYKY